MTCVAILRCCCPRVCRLHCVLLLALAHQRLTIACVGGLEQVDRRGRDITRDYQIQRKIGSGNYSTVHRGVNLRTQEVVAIKVASKRTLTQEDIDAVYVEVDVLQEVRGGSDVGRVGRVVPVRAPNHSERVTCC